MPLAFSQIILSYWDYHFVCDLLVHSLEDTGTHTHTHNIVIPHIHLYAKYKEKIHYSLFPFASYSCLILSSSWLRYCCCYFGNNNVFGGICMHTLRTFELHIIQFHTMLFWEQEEDDGDDDDDDAILFVLLSAWFLFGTKAK